MTLGLEKKNIERSSISRFCRHLILHLEGLRNARALVKGNVPPADYGLGKGLNKANRTRRNPTKKWGGACEWEIVVSYDSNDCLSRNSEALELIVTIWRNETSQHFLAIK